MKAYSLEEQLALSVRAVQARKLRSGYRVDPETGCWLWLKSLNNKGYGKVCGFGDGKSVLAHRFSYALHRGPIPVGLVLDHKCRTPACVNPDHLEPVTQRENTKRGRLAHVEQTGKCARGHVVTKRNRRGNLYCQECNTLWHRNRKKLCLTGSR